MGGTMHPVTREGRARGESRRILGLERSLPHPPKPALFVPYSGLGACKSLDS